MSISFSTSADNSKGSINFDNVPVIEVAGNGIATLATPPDANATGNGIASFDWVNSKLAASGGAMLPEANSIGSVVMMYHQNYIDVSTNFGQFIGNTVSMVGVGTYGTTIGGFYFSGLLGLTLSGTWKIITITFALADYLTGMGGNPMGYPIAMLQRIA